jgi:hypothetical protein
MQISLKNACKMIDTSIGGYRMWVSGMCSARNEVQWFSPVYMARNLRACYI